MPQYLLPILSPQPGSKLTVSLAAGHRDESPSGLMDVNVNSSILLHEQDDRSSNDDWHQTNLCFQMADWLQEKAPGLELPCQRWCTSVEHPRKVDLLASLQLPQQWKGCCSCRHSSAASMHCINPANHRFITAMKRKASTREKCCFTKPCCWWESPRLPATSRGSLLELPLRLPGCGQCRRVRSALCNGEERSGGLLPSCAFE